MSCRRKKSGMPIVSVLMVCLVVFTAGAGLPGCITPKVKLVGTYDEITDRAVTDLQKKTASFFQKMKSSAGGEASYNNSTAFYDEARGDVAALIMRAEVIEKGLKVNPLTKNFRDLQKQYEDLAGLHKTNPPPAAFASAEKALDQSFRAILTNILYLKWNQEQPE
ncbi:MAG: hypothetical protein AB2L13_04220 [Spirochaetota bacterium]